MVKTIINATSVSFSCVAESNPSSNISWIHHGLIIENNGNFTIKTIYTYTSYTVSNSTLTINSVNSSQNGTYTCIASNEIGNDSEIYTLLVYGEIIDY